MSVAIKYISLYITKLHENHELVKTTNTSLQDCQE